MQVFEEKERLRSALLQARQQGETIALVATMGCLHAGHLSLIRLAQQKADRVVVSIYVNPLQFAVGEDLACYPRPLADDLQLCEAEQVAMVFCPQSLYPSEPLHVSLCVDALDQVLCGQARPKHFDGVVTAVQVLFNIIQPHVAVFGEKDFQQLCILRRMVHDLSIPVEVLAAPIVRAKNGLALSSRNRYLDDVEYELARQLHQCLQGIASQVRAGENRVACLLQWGRTFLAKFSLHVQYLEIRESEKLQTLDILGQHCCRVFIAASIGQTRLIDNLELPCK